MRQTSVSVVKNSDCVQGALDKVVRFRYEEGAPSDSSQLGLDEERGDTLDDDVGVRGVEDFSCYRFGQGIHERLKNYSQFHLAKNRFLDNL